MDKTAKETKKDMTWKESGKKGDSIIRVEGLKREFHVGKVVTYVLKGISFEVKRSEFAGIMGPSGCGKSTTLHQLALLDTPDAGKIIIDGVDVTALDENQRSRFRLMKLGYVFQQYRNLPELTALENVYLPAMMLGRDSSEYIPEAKRLLEMVGLGHRLGHRPYEMSGGEQQRVAIARALINKPAIIFADEPTASLDTASTDVIVNLLSDLHKKGQTIIMVSHEPEHAKVFDKVIRVRDGLVEKIEYNKR